MFDDRKLCSTMLDIMFTYITDFNLEHRKPVLYVAHVLNCFADFVGN